MANRFEIPQDVEARLRKRFKLCAYCGRRMRMYAGMVGVPKDKATIEHLNRKGPFYWSRRLQEKHLVLACGQCNASRGQKRLTAWFASPYCVARRICAKTVAFRVRQYLRTPAARR